MATTALNAPPRRPRRPRRLKRPIRRRPTTMLGFLALGAAATVVALGLAVGAYIFDSAYHVAHQQTPVQASDSFLDAVLNKRDPSISSNYVCDSGNALKKAKSLIRQIKSFTGQGNQYFVTYNWQLRQRRKTDDRATVLAKVHTETTIGQSSMGAPAQRWTLRLRNHSGWKVCELHTKQ